MNNTIRFLTMIITFLPLYLLFAFIPYMTRKTESFGIGIPEDKYYDPETAGLRKKYRNRILVICGILILSVFII